MSSRGVVHIAYQLPLLTATEPGMRLNHEPGKGTESAFHEYMQASPFIMLGPLDKSTAFLSENTFASLSKSLSISCFLIYPGLT